MMAVASLAGGLLVAAAAAKARRVVRRAEPQLQKAPAPVTAKNPIPGEADIPRPEDLLESPKFPLFIGSSGGYMSKSTRERHAITWTSKEELLFMHPADGVFPEKVNKGRVQVNGRPHTVCQNPYPGQLKDTQYRYRAYEADALTTLFCKAQLEAFQDRENLFPMPNVSSWMEKEQTEGQ